jgi:hypothetical protein
MAAGSWLMNMLMPPAAAATIPPGYSGGGYSGGGGRTTTILGDKGGLAATVSAGEGGWNSVNYGTTGSASQMKLIGMTIGQVEKLQSQGKVFAVGAYQFTPGVLARARRDAGLSPNEVMTPENQTKLFWGLALGGKRPSLAAYDAAPSHRAFLSGLALPKPSGLRLRLWMRSAARFSSPNKK